MSAPVTLASSPSSCDLFDHRRAWAHARSNNSAEPSAGGQR